MISFFIFHQDVGFSLMQHPRFPHGTLFITFEQGFRWYVEDWLPLCVRTSTSQFPTYEFLSMKIEGAVHEDFSDDDGLDAKRRGKTMDHQGLGGSCQPKDQAGGTRHGVLSRDLRPRVCTEPFAIAHRGHGEVVWFG